MVLDESKIHNALLQGNNVLDDEIRNNFHCEINPISAMLGGKDRLQAMHERGNFCLSFKFWKNGDNAKMKPQKCVRVWLSDTIINKDRYLLISKGLTTYNLPYFTNFTYLENGLNIEGNKIPAIIMDWIDGKTMTLWLPDNKSTPDKIGRLADNFMEMSCKLNKLQIAHGDLCSENILVTSSCDIKLVDYDSVYVPNMDGKSPTVTAGWPDYQHPQRANNPFVTAKDDYFSQHVIYLSLLTYSRFPQLIPDKPEKSLLFTSSDYNSNEAFVGSNAYRYIKENCKIGNDKDEIILNELNIIENAITNKIELVPPLVPYISKHPEVDEKSSPLGVGKTKVDIQKTTNPKNSTSQGTYVYGGQSIPKPGEQTHTQKQLIETPWYKRWYAWVCALIIAIGIGSLIINGISSGSNTNIQTVDNIGIVKAIDKIEGNYTLREKNGSTSINGIRTAAIKKTSDSEARILVTSEYGPEFYDFTFTSDGKIQSEKLGTGEIAYNERLDKITITFKEGERICEFTK